jgi:hypothetical protein
MGTNTATAVCSYSTNHRFLTLHMSTAIRSDKLTKERSTMSATNTFNILAQIHQIAPNARSTSKVHARTSKRDDIAQARQKTVDKLQANKAYFLDQTLDRPDLVYKQQADGTYTIGIKYGNRYLKSIADGKPYIESIQQDQVVRVLELLAQTVLDGHYDAEIERIMADNVGNRNKATH